MADPSKTITGLSANTEHTYSIRANNDDGSSSYSAEKKIKTAPNPPADIKVTTTQDSVTLSWDKIDGATSYDVTIDGTTYNVTDPSKTINGLPANTEHTYSVRANNEDGSSSYSTEKKVKTAPNPPADANVTTTEDAIIISWDKIDGATSYDVMIDGITYNVTDPSKTISGLPANTEHTYSIRAKNNDGLSSYSAEKRVRTAPKPPVDAKVTVTEDTIIISWDKIDGATSYDVMIDGTIYNVTDPSKTITGLTPGTKHTYSVRSNNEDGSSTYSDEKIITTKWLPTPTVSATATQDSVTISWDAVKGATSYDVMFNGKVYNKIGNTVTFTELNPETEYTYAVCAKNESGSGDYSKTNTISTLMAVPAIPSDVNATSTMSTVKISWSPVSGATSYDVDFDGVVYNVIGTAKRFKALRLAKRSTGKVYKTVFDLIPNTKHSYCVRANNEAGSSDYSEVKNILTQISKKNGLPNFKSNKAYPDGKIPYMGLDPVNALTGAYLWSYTYLEDYGKDSLHFTVMYDSQREGNHKALGSKWTYALNYRLYMDSEYAYFSTPYDEVVPFSFNAAKDKFQLAEGVQSNYVMGRNDDRTYFVRDIDGVEYIFDNQLCLSKIVEGGITTYWFRADKLGQIICLEGRHGGNLTLEYTNGHITRVVDIMGNVVTFAYDGDHLVSAVNADGNSMFFTYDTIGNLLEISDFSGKSHVTNQYDSKNRVVLQNTAGRGDTFASYDEDNKETIFTDELGNSTKYSYDEGFHVTGVELAGIHVQNKYNENGQLTERMDGLGNITKMAYDECGRMNYVVNPDGSEERIQYNDRNYPIRMVNRDGTESSYEYDARNNLISVQDERGHASYYSYDDYDNLISYKDKNGYIWKYEYDSDHHLKQAEDPAGNIYQYSHDVIGRLLSYTSPTGNATTYQYSKTGELLRIVDVDGTVTFDYNKNGNNTGITDKMGNKQHLEYNEMGQVSLATDFMGNEYHFVYDERGKLVKETDPLGYSQSNAYDAYGNNTEKTDKNGGTTNFTFNAANQLMEVRDAAGSIIKYTYDTMGQVKTITDPLNNQTNYTYDVMGRITGIVNALGYGVSRTYDKAGNLLTKTDENGAVIEYSYDNENRLASVKSDQGIIHFTYDKLGRVIGVQDTDGYSETTLYDADGNITEFKNKESSKTTYAYDKSGRLSEETDPNGNKTFYVYDHNGNCTKITDAEGNQYSYQYDANNQLIKITDPAGHETAYEYDARQNLLSVTDARGGKTGLTYDGNGNLVKEINPAGGVKVYSYDCLNRLTGTEDEEGHKQSFVYDANGNMTMFTDANQNKWEYEYDAINRMTVVKDQNGGHMAYEYQKTGEIAKITDQEGAETTYHYDSMGRLTEMSDALKNSLHFTYDSMGRIISQKDANGNATEYEYSPSGNLLLVKDSEGNLTVYTYDSLGQVLTETDALGSVISYQYDALGQITSITDAMRGKSSFTYTVNGKIASVTDTNGGITQYQYDACGNLTQTTDPLGNIVAYEYDVMNNQIKECLVTSKEQVCATIYQYDKKGRMVREINPLLDEKAYTYDGNGNIVTILDEDRNETKLRYDLNNKPVLMCYSDGKEALFRYNKRGELVELKDWNGTVTMEYGRPGKLSKVTDHNGRITSYGYDANGNTTNIGYPDGSAVSYTYDKNNRITKVTDAEQQEAKYAYDAVGNILSIQQPGGTSAYTYNAKSLPTQAKYQLVDGTQAEHNFEYNAMGNIISREMKGSTPQLSGSATYTYDAIGQLLSYKDGQITESYGYDVLGNRILKNVGGRQKASCQYNALNQLTGRTEDGIQYSYGYDKRGNLTEEKRGDSLIRQYIYDATGHMVMGKDLESGEQTEYGYNALYMRVKNVQTLKNQTSSTTPFVTRDISYVTDYLSGTNNDLLSYEKGYASVRATYGCGYERLNQKVMLEPEAPATARAVIAATNIGKSYFQPDLAGSALFASNGQGEVLRYAERSAWGDLKIPLSEDMNSAGVENSLRFTSYCYDPVIDKHFAHARFYDANQGRMLAKDPVKRGLNAYPYCKSNPVNYVDPTGEIANILGAGIIGGLVGGGFGFAGSAVSQISDGEEFDVKKALGSAANGAVVGAVRGALVGSGVGLAAGLAYNFAAGAAGSALEQKIGMGSVNVGQSVVGGLTNAVSGAIYGNKALKSAQDALLRGAGAGAATAAINNLSNAWNNQNSGLSGNTGNLNRTTGGLSTSPYAVNRDPRAVCGASSPFENNIGYRTGYGYQSRDSESKQTKQGGFSLVDFGKDVLIGAVMGGLSSLTFYGAGKAVEAVKGSIRNVRENRRGRNPDPRIKLNLQFFADKGGSDIKYSPVNPGPLKEGVANSFNGGTYTEKILTRNTEMYRVSGGSAGKIGSYLSRTPQGGGLQSQLDLALNPAWGNSVNNIGKAIVPRGTKIYEGFAAPQKYL